MLLELVQPIVGQIHKLHVVSMLLVHMEWNKFACSWGQGMNYLREAMVVSFQRDSK